MTWDEGWGLPSPLQASQSSGKSSRGCELQGPSHPAGAHAARRRGLRGPGAPGPRALARHTRGWGSPGRCCLRSGPAGSGWAGAAPPRVRGSRPGPPPGPGTGAAPHRGPGGADSSPPGTCRPERVPSALCCPPDGALVSHPTQVPKRVASSSAQRRGFDQVG